jgi:hydrogenase maturation protease
LNPNRTESNRNCPESKKNQSLKDSGQSFLNVLVLGIGNILLSDEGAGIKAVEELQSRYNFSDAVEIIDGGTMGLELLPYFEERSHILIIDAVKTGNKPGAIVRIEDPPAFLQKKISPHQIGLSDVLAIAAITDNLPQNVTLFGIEPKQLSTGLDLSTEVARNLSQLVDMVAAELKDIGVEVQPKNQSF